MSGKGGLGAVEAEHGAAHDDRVTAVTAPMTCRQCGGAIRWLAGGGTDEHEARCMVKCAKCGAEFLVIVRMALTRTVMGKSR